MKSFLNKIISRKKAYKPYVYLFLWSFFVGLSFLFQLTPIILIFRIIWFIFFPGILLVKIFKFNFNQILSNQIVTSLAAGLVYNFLICFMAIIFGVNITFLGIMYFMVLGLILILSIVMDVLRAPQIPESKNSFKSIFCVENLVFVIPAAVTILIVFVAQAKGANFDGDPTYHLGIMRKVIENNPLGINTLSFVKDKPHPAYAAMIWPAFLALLAKINNLNIFSLWNQMPTILTLLVGLVWTWLFAKTVSQKTIAALCASIFLIIMFYPSGYIYTRLPVPDTFAFMILMPLAVGLTLEYLLIDGSIKLMVLISLLLFSMGFVHLTQFVYFFLILGFFVIWFLIFNFRNFKINGLNVLKRAAALSFVSALLLAPFFIWIQLQSKILSSNISIYQSVEEKNNYMDTFAKFKTFAKYAYLSFPLVLLFIKSRPKIILFWSLMLVAPIIYHVHFLNNFFYNTFSFVFMDRLYVNTTWYYAVLGSVIGFVIVVFERIIVASIKPSQKLLILINGLLGLITAGLIYKEFKSSWLSNFFNNLFSKSNDYFLNDHYIVITGAVFALTILILILQYYFPKINLFFQEIWTTKNSLITFWFVLIFTFWFLSPVLVGVNKIFMKNPINSMVKPVEDSTDKIIEPSNYGGSDTLDYIRKNIPSRMVFESNTAYRALPMMLDEYMTAWPDHSKPEKEFSELYQADVSSEQKLKCIAYGNMDYILFSPGSKFSFDLESKYLNEIYKTKDVQIYQVNKTAIKSLNFNLSEVPVCRAAQYR